MKRVTLLPQCLSHSDLKQEIGTCFCYTEIFVNRTCFYETDGTSLTKYLYYIQNNVPGDGDAEIFC